MTKVSSLWESEEERKEAYRALGKDKETSPIVAGKVRSQIAALEAKGFVCSQPAQGEDEQDVARGAKVESDWTASEHVKARRKQGSPDYQRGEEE